MGSSRNDSPEIAEAQRPETSETNTFLPRRRFEFFYMKTLVKTLVVLHSNI